MTKAIIEPLDPKAFNENMFERIKKISKQDKQEAKKRFERAKKIQIQS